MYNKNVIYAGECNTGKTRFLLSSLVNYVNENKNNGEIKYIVFLTFDDHISTIYRTLYNIIFKEFDVDNKKNIQTYFNDSGYKIDIVNMSDIKGSVVDLLHKYNNIGAVFIDNLSMMHFWTELYSSQELTTQLIDYLYKYDISFYASLQLSRVIADGSNIINNKTPEYLNRVNDVYTIVKEQHGIYNLTSLKTNKKISYKMTDYGEMCKLI